MSAVRPKILLLDDEADLVRRWTDSLKKLPTLTNIFPDITPLDAAAFAKEFEILRRRQAVSRNAKTWSDTSIFDSAAILVVDYDLIGMLDTKLYATGEEVSYLVRCFSNCGLVVGLNFEPGNRFDLTLRDHPESFADLHIPAVQVANPALWGIGDANFRPWSWPVLSRQWALFDQQTEDALKNLDKPICEVLGFPAEVVASFSRSVAEFLGSTPSSTTFRMLAHSSGLRDRDAALKSDQVLARIAAARVSKWLESIVLPGQDILVDAPHLAWRYPSLLTNDASDIKNWDSLCSLRKPADKLGIDSEKIKKAQFVKEHWLSRPAWYWKVASTETSIREVAEPWGTKTPPFVFCEDCSSFRERKVCREFVAEMESPYARRYVAQVDGIAYAPQVRFAS